MLVGVRRVTYGGDSGNRIFVLYWRCPLIRVSVIRGSTVLPFLHRIYWAYNNISENPFHIIDGQTAIRFHRIVAKVTDT
jgi:hypothetical protein